MKKLRSDAYETQLTPPELEQLHTALLQPGADLTKIQLSLPAWRTGPYAGARPSLRTLSGIAARLRGHNSLAALRECGRLLRDAKKAFKSGRGVAPDTATLLQDIYHLIGFEVIDQTLDGGNNSHRDFLLRLLLKREQIALETKKLQLRAAKQRITLQ